MKYTDKEPWTCSTEWKVEYLPELNSWVLHDGQGMVHPVERVKPKKKKKSTPKAKVKLMGAMVNEPLMKIERKIHWR